jgi:hypothetical protein
VILSSRYANHDKIGRIIQSFRTKARNFNQHNHGANERWEKLMWSAYLREGVHVRSDCALWYAAVAIQRIWRGRQARCEAHCD